MNAIRRFILRTQFFTISIFIVAVLAASAHAFPRKPGQGQAAQPQAAPSPLLATMRAELDRSMPVLGHASPPAYFINYSVTQSRRVQVMGSNGALLDSSENLNRFLEVQVRVGSYELDDTHKVGGQESSQLNPGATAVPLEDDPAVLRRAIWLETDKQYRAAAEALVRIQTNKEVQVQSAEEGAPDFSHEKPKTFYGPEAAYQLDRKPWEQKVRDYTAYFRQSSDIINSIVTFTAQAENQYEVNSEGTQIQFGQVRFRLELFIQGKAPDGMDLNRYYNFDWVDSKEEPTNDAVFAAEKTMRSELEGLVKAPLVEPYAGPSMLTGRAAAVFFHEVFGHRDEGFRQKDVSEGQTFARKVGESIMPDFISIVDDPTKLRLNKDVLLGSYPFDDEGVPSQRVVLVDKGVLRGFEMSRQPLKEFPNSNGHGRRQLGAAPDSRQGNLIVESNRKVSNAELRRLFIEEIKKQGKTFGLLFDDIAGGFTFTGRGQPQAFRVEPLVVYKVYADGRPDELVRGVNIVGTPLLSLMKIVATGDTTEVFNGYCGAESGSVPVSAAAPPMVISEMEVEKKESSTDRPPVLPPPAHDHSGDKQ
ncbi:MAG TPA: metallopeptidase TldD-related protein [Candidatus Limnocylindrales bacterium]|nr:metallopeptidase TldD-related protein [Candidatus Limnocylindrales bacterium]